MAAEGPKAFINILNAINAIDKLYSDGTAKIGEQKSDEIAKRAHKKKQESLEKARKEEAQLLSQAFSEVERKCLVQILDGIKVEKGILQGPEKKADEQSGQMYSGKYPRYFNEALYNRILPYCQLAQEYEQNGIAEEHADKLSLIFDDLREIVKFLKENKNVHDACLFYQI